MTLHARAKTCRQNSGHAKGSATSAARYISIAALSPLLLAAALILAVLILVIGAATLALDSLIYAWWGAADTIHWWRECKRRDGRAREFCLAGIPEADQASFKAQLLSIAAEMAWEAARADRASKERTAK